MQKPFVRFDHVEKSYDGKVLVVQDLTLDIAQGEFLTLLGPSGSGKTTTLMMLAGFETATAGEIYLDGKPINRIAPEHRNIGMVFQSYALFPHMTVAENVGFPLSVRGVTGEAARSRVMAALDKVGLKGLESRRPAQMSGGQQQRGQWRARWCLSRSWC
jgi:putative spermidine/putrescine transport system ATP-binding protein